MAIPPNGWVTASFSGVTRHPLPVPLVISYYDTFRFGKVNSIRLLKAGGPEIVDRSGYRVIDIQLTIKNVHDVALIDRIE